MSTKLFKRFCAACGADEGETLETRCDLCGTLLHVQKSGSLTVHRPSATLEVQLHGAPNPLLTFIEAAETSDKFVALLKPQALGGRAAFERADGGSNADYTRLQICGPCAERAGIVQLASPAAAPKGDSDLERTKAMFDRANISYTLRVVDGGTELWGHDVEGLVRRRADGDRAMCLGFDATGALRTPASSETLSDDDRSRE